MAIKISGVTIIDDSRNIVSGAAATFTSNVTIGGTLTYEDVTNIDSVGIVTARQDVHIGESIVHIGDTNTKISFPSNDTIRLETASNTITADNNKTTFGRPIRVGDYIAHNGVDSLGVKFFNQGTGNNNTFIGLGAEDNGTSGGNNHKTFQVFRQGSSVNRVFIDNFGNLRARQGFTVAGISTFSDTVKIGTGVTALTNGNVSIGGTLELFNTTGNASNNPSEIKLSTFSIGQHNNVGTMKIMNNNATGTLIIGAGGGGYGGILLYNKNLNARYLQAHNEESVEIFYNNVARFETSGIGATVYGQLDTTDLNVAGVSTFIGEIEVKNTSPKLLLTDTNANSDYSVHVENGTFHVRDETNSENRIRVESDGTIQFKGDVDVTGVSTFAGNISANGNIIGDDSTNISGINSVTATEYYGTGGIGSKLFVQDSQNNLIAGFRAGIAITTGDVIAQRNILIGYDAGRRMCCGCHNVIMGDNAFERIHRGRCNVAIGLNVGTAFTTGAKVTNGIFLGRYAASCQTSDTSNAIIIGNAAGKNGTANTSVVIGASAGQGVVGQTHTNNIFIGNSAGLSISTGGSNVVIGQGAGKCMCCGGSNIYLGINAGKCDTRGCGNIALGTAAMCACNSGGMVAGKPNCNVVLGNHAGTSISTGDHNFLGGTYAGCNLISGTYNVAIGNAALFCTTTSSHNIALGLNAARCNVTGTHNLAFGFCALFSATSDGCNISIGKNTLRCFTTGCSNTVMGYTAASCMTSGCFNIFLGDQAACCFVSGSNNIAIGCRVCVPLDTGSNQLAIGARCCYWLTGDSSYNVGIGSTQPQGKLDVGGTIFANQLSVAGFSTFTSKITAQDRISITSNNGSILFGSGNDSFQCRGGIGVAGQNNYHVKGTSAGDFVISARRTKKLVFGTGDPGNQQGATAKRAQIDDDGSFRIFRSLFVSQDVNVSGILTANGIEISGVSTFSEDVDFIGDNNNIKFDKSASSLKFLDDGSNPGAKAAFGTGNDLQIFHSQGANYIKVVNLQSLNFATNNTNRAMFESGGHFRPIVDSTYDLGINATRWRNVYADTYYGNGANLTGITADGIGAIGGLTIKDQGGSVVGTGGSISTLDFSGSSGVTVTATSGAAGIATIAIRGIFEQTDVGINTVSKVGIGTTNPIAQLDVNVGSGVTAFNIEGSEGQLFSVTNNLSSGSIFAVNDITGLPSIDVDADGTIQLAPRGVGELVGIGTTAPTSKLHVVGDTFVTGVATFTGSKFDIQSTGESFVTRTGGNTGSIVQVISGNQSGQPLIEFRQGNSGVGQIGKIGTTGLRITSDSLALKSQTGFENYLYATYGGAVKLYYDNADRFETTNTGVSITGNNVVSGNVTAVDGTFSGNVSIAGTLTYEDVTNIDSVGIITSREGIFVPDDKSIRVGGTFDNPDLKIHSSSSLDQAVIDYNRSGTGRALRIRATNLQIENWNGLTPTVKVIGGLGAGHVELNYAGTKKFETTPNGIDVTGGLSVTGVSTFAGITTTNSTLFANQLNVAGVSTFNGNVIVDGVLSVKSGNESTDRLQVGDSGQLRIYHAGHNYYRSHSSTAFHIFTVNGGEVAASLKPNGSVDLFYDNVRKFRTSSDGAEIVGILTATSIKTPKYDGDADRNIIMGCCAGIAITDTVTDACRNVIIGCSAGRKVCTGTNAVIIGACAGHELTNSGANVLIGEFTACRMCCGFNNVVIGKRAGMGLTGRTSCADTSLGANSNIFLGSYAGNCMRRECNIVIGTDAGRYNENGQQNVIIGSHAGRGPSSSFATNCGYANVFLGSGAGSSARGGSYNVAIGRNVGSSISTGGNHIFIGCGAGTSQISGINNIFMGNLAGACATTGSQSIFLGQQAGRLLTTGNLKIAIGDNAGEKGMGDTSSGGIAIGYCSQRCATAANNVTVGNSAGKCLTQGHNTIFGNTAAHLATAACCNTFIGNFTAGCFTTGSRNTFVGGYAGFGQTTGNFNIYFGVCSGPRSCGATGNYNIMFGRCTANAMCTGDNNILIGEGAAQCLRNACRNVILGRNAGKGVTSGKSNFYVGNHAGPTACGHTGSHNIALGDNAMRNSTGGASCNIALGLDAGNDITGNYNVILGCGAALDSTSLNHSIIIGCEAGQKSTGDYTLSIGVRAGRCNTTGIRNVNLGFCAGHGITTGESNISIGRKAGAQDCGASGEQNISIGHRVGCDLTSGNYNTFLGSYGGNNITSGNYNIAIGYDIALPSATGNAQLAIGCGSNRWIAGDSSYNTTLAGIATVYAATGIVSATSFSGSGANLTGLTGASAATYGNSTNTPVITVDASGRITTITTAAVSGGGGISTTFFASSAAAGIHTLSKVGIGTAIPQAQLDVNVGSGVTAFNVSGSEGQLFSVTNNLTSGSIFEVNDVSGMPSIDVDADGTIQLAPHGVGELVGIGTTAPTSKLHVVGDTLVTGISTFNRIESTATSFGIINTADRILMKGNNRIDLADNRVRFQSRDQTTILLDAVQGSTGFVNLYQNNNIKLTTTPDGVKITGTDAELLFNATRGTGHQWQWSTSGTNATGIELRDTTANQRAYIYHDSTGLGGSYHKWYTDGTLRFEVLGSHVNIPNDNTRLRIGTSADLQLYHDGNDSHILDNGTGDLIINGSTVKIKHNSQDRFETTSTGIKLPISSGGDGVEFFNSGDIYPEIVGNMNRTLGDKFLLSLAGKWNNNHVVGKIAIETGDDTTNKDDGRITFFTAQSGGNIAERLEIEPDGNVRIPADNAKLQIGGGQDLALYHDGTNSRIHNTSTGNLIIRNEVQDADVSIQGNDGGSNITMLAFDASEAGNATFTGNIKLTDGKFLQLGQSNDLSLTHTFINNSHNGVINNATNTLFIESDSITIRDKSGEGGEVYAQMVKNGAVSLRHDNNLRFETTSTGAKVTGNLEVTGVLTYEDVTNVDSIGIITARSGINVSGNSTFTGDVELTSTDSGAAAAPTLKLQRDSSSPANGDILGQIMFGGKDSTPNDEQYAMVAGKIIQAGAGGEHGAIQITTRKQSAHVITANLTSTDYQLLNGTNLSVDGDITGNGNFQLTSTDTGSAAAPELTLHRNSASPADADYLGQIKFSGKHDAGSSVNYAKITGKILDASNGTEDGILEFMLRKAGSNNIAARFRSDSLQLLNGTNLSVNGTSTFEDDVSISGQIQSSYNHASNPRIHLTGISGSGGYNYLLRGDNDVGSRAVHFVNGSARSADNGANTYTIRNDNGKLHLGRSTQLTVLQGSTTYIQHNTSTKLQTSSTGVDVTGNVNATGNLDLTDSGRVMLGTGDDLQIYHTGSASKIDVYTTGLEISTDGVETLAKFNRHSSVELWHDGTKRFETTSTGAKVTGQLNVAAGRIILDQGYQLTWANGSTNRARIHGDSGNNFIVENGSSNTERLRITSDGKVGIGSAIPATTLDIFASTNTPSSDTGTTMLQLTNDTGSDIKGVLGQKTFIDFKFLDTNFNFTPQVRIGAQVGTSSGADAGIANEGSGNFVVYTATGTVSGGTLSEKFRVTNDGKVGISQSQPSRELSIHSADSGSTYLQLTNSTTGTGVNDGLIMGVGADEVARIRQTENNDLTFSTNDTERMFIKADGKVQVGTGVTIEGNGQATFVGVVTFGSSSTTIDGNSDTINVGTALTIGHTQGIQFHSQNLHSTGFEVNNINATGIITATNFAKEDGTPIASTDIAINTLSSSSATGGGSASFNGTAYRFTLSEPPDTSVYQLFVSINGVIQKPNAGSSQPSEGFAIDGNDIIFGSPPPAGSPFFIQTFKTVGISSIPPQAQVSTTSAAKSVKNVTTSTSAPTNSNGVDGDLWFTYIA